MPDDTIATAQIEIVASLDGLLSGLDEARYAVSDSLDTIDESIVETRRMFSSVFDPLANGMVAATSDASQATAAWRSLGDAAVSLASDVEGLITQLAILDPLFNSLSAGPAMIPGFGDIVGPLLNGMVPFAFNSVGSDISGGATENQPATSPTVLGERVNLTSSNDRGGPGSAAVTNVNVVNNSGAQAHVQERPNSRGGKDVTVIIGEAMGRDVRINGPLGRAIRQTFGAGRIPIQR